MLARWRPLRPSSILHRTFQNASSRTNPSPRPPPPPSGLSHSYVESKLSSFPSDLTALGFFLWCARQPNYFHGPGAFDRAVPIVRRLTDRLGSVARIVGELKSIGCPAKAQTFLVLLRIYWRGGMYRLALEAFGEMENYGYAPNVFARNAVLDILFRTGRAGEAMEFLRSTRSPNFLTFNIAIRYLCGLKDYAGVRDVLRSVRGFGFRPNVGTFLVVMDFLCKTGRLKESLQVLGFMVVVGERPSVEIWTVLIHGFGRLSQVDFAVELLEKMVECGSRPNVVTYTSLIKGLVEAGKLDRALDILDVMISNGCEPDLVLYNVLIDGLCKARRYSDGFRVFLSLKEKNVKPDSYTVSIVLSAFCSSGKITLFPELVSGINVPLDLVMCNTLVNVFCKAGLPSMAVKFYDVMVDMGFTPDCYSYAGLLESLLKSGRIDEAIKVYRGILVSGSCCIDAHVHTVMVDGLIKRGELHRAIKMFRNAVLEKCHVDVASFTVAIHGLFKCRRFEEAYILFNQMKQEGLNPNNYTYNVMLNGSLIAKDVSAAAELLKDMDNEGVDLDSISSNAIVELLFRTRRVHSAFHVFMAMLNLGFKPSEASCALLYNGLHLLPVEEQEDFHVMLKSYTDRYKGSVDPSLPDSVVCRLISSASKLIVPEERCLRNAFLKHTYHPAEDMLIEELMTMQSSLCIAEMRSNKRS
ncbi:hypothetical protein QJS04_geneDACA012182 [Acorus gramineus]|uniref:Pentatricopeptide repeat-containing protein n=1 Tax=Acorus gramineus TaxID=55184 RepID=A0AAV9BA03_ACOGR|nr:hypothetical protein QJS04_geneDACA012182 [Acorus gramineus]